MPKVSFRRMFFLAALTLLLGWVRPASAQDAVTLRPFATIPNAGPVRLADVADLSGGLAESLADTVLVPSCADSASISLPSIRETLERAGLNFARIRLAGGVCNVRVAAKPAPTPPAAREHPPAAPGTTLRDLLATRIADALGAAPSDLRLSFDDSDARLLATPTPGRVVATDPIGTGDRMPFSVRVYEDDRIVASGVVRVGVLVRRDVMVAVSALPRATALSQGDVRTEERWLPPSVCPAPPSSLGTHVSRTRLAMGDIIEARHLESPVVVKKGDVVSIDCVSGGVVVRVNARAVEQGRDGDTILFQGLNSKNTFRARLNGPGCAVALARN